MQGLCSTYSYTYKETCYIHTDLQIDVSWIDVGCIYIKSSVGKDKENDNVNHLVKVCSKQMAHIITIWQLVHEHTP